MPALPPEPRPRRVLRRVRRTVRAHRRGLAALLAFLAVLSAMAAARPDPPPDAPLVVAARDLTSGTTIGPGDVEVRRVGPDEVPSGAYTATGALEGRRVAAPVRSGSALTDWSLARETLLAGHPPGSVLASVRLADPASLTGVRVGDHVHVVASDPQGERAPEVLARDVPVAVLPPSDDSAWDGDGGVVVLVLPEPLAVRVAGAAGRDRLDVVVAGRTDPGVVG